MRTSPTKTAKLKIVKAKAKKPNKGNKAKATAKTKTKTKAQMKPPRRTSAPAKRSRPEAQLTSIRVKARERSDDGNAFIRDPGEGPARTRDDLAEVLAEDFIGAATSGNDVLEDDLERETSDELGGPFVETRASIELADDVDESNPVDAEAEALPRAVAGLVERSVEDELDDEDDEPSVEPAR
ncbi:MAG TPA: hypothetical protein VK989_00060 [Polyangia bacterium]|nr:hypothetical protein [Polyangia bacterium]